MILYDQPFTPGYKYYYEVTLDKGSLIKIGVSLKEINLEEVTFRLYLYLEKAFSDTNNGWAMYNGELRHNSNSTGPKYGNTYKAGDIIGVFMDTIEVNYSSTL